MDHNFNLMIDKISYQIMNELREDGRLTNADIARKLDINIATVSKKITTMIEKGMIVINAMPDPLIMGYRIKAVIGFTVKISEVDNVCNKLIKNIHVHMVSSGIGRFDVLAIVFFENLSTLQEYLKCELNKVSGIISFKTFFISDFIKESEAESGKQASEDTAVFTLDDLDRNLIAELVIDGRPNHAAIAKKLNTSKPTISRRISSLIKDKAIRIIAIPNPSKIGFTANAYIFVKTETDNIDLLCERLSAYPEIHFVKKIINESDILLGIYSISLNSLFRFIHGTLGRMDEIFHIDTFICGDFFYLKHCRISFNDTLNSTDK